MRIPSSNALRPHEFGTRRNVFFNDENFFVAAGIDKNMIIVDIDCVTIFRNLGLKIK